jgi:hypothetical protein
VQVPTLSQELQSPTIALRRSVHHVDGLYEAWDIVSRFVQCAQRRDAEAVRAAEQDLEWFGGALRCHCRCRCRCQAVGTMRRASQATDRGRQSPEHASKIGEVASFVCSALGHCHVVRIGGRSGCRYDGVGWFLRPTTQAVLAE